MRRLGTIFSVLVFALLTVQFVQANNSQALIIQHTISEEPLLGGAVTYNVTLENPAGQAVVDKLYNVTMTNTLPVGQSFVSASIAPTFVGTNAEGATVLLWENFSDIEVAETLELSISAELDPSVTLNDSFTNLVTVEANTVPDNSGAWITNSDSLGASPQAVDIELVAQQSTGDEQATGAGEYDNSADWPYSYRATVRNNEVAATDNVVAQILLPAGVAYLGNPLVDGATQAPTLDLNADGSLLLTWQLGTLTTADYDSPVEIVFDTAIPYRLRTGDDVSAESGPFAGPMSGSVIAEDHRTEVVYNATGDYDQTAVEDGSTFTPNDDEPVVVIAEYLTIAKNVTPQVVGIGTTVTFQLDYYVSEYYAASNVTIVDQLPDGMTLVNNSASTAINSIQASTPTAGQTTLVWNIPTNQTTPGSHGTITFEATVDATYSDAPLTGQPIVSGDSITNQVTISGDWADQISAGRNGSVTPDTSTATVSTRFPTLTKQVFDVDSNSWTDVSEAFTGDTVSFRVQYASANNVDAKEIVIRDFLPRGMTFVANSDSYSVTGNYANSATCTSAPAQPTIGTLNGLQYLEWKLCNAEQGATWQVELDALIGDSPSAQPHWIVANMGKMSGQNSYGEAYSERALATVDYVAPEITLTKSAAPRRNLDPNDTLTYSIELTNNGDATAYHLVVTDTVPADLLIAASANYQTVSGNPAGGEGGVIVWNEIASLAAGESVTLQYAAIVDSDVIAGQKLTNIATVSYNSREDFTGHQTLGTNNTSDKNTDDELIIMRRAAIDKSSVTAAEFVPGALITYTLVVPGDPLTLPMNNVRVNDPINAQLQILGADNATVQGQTVVANFAQIPAGSQETITIYAQLPFETNAMAGDAITNQATLNYDNFSNKKSNKVTDYVVVPALTTDKFVSQAMVEAGDTITYTVSFANVGNATAVNLMAEDVLPSNMSFVAGSAKLDGQPFGDPINNAWMFNTVQAGEQHTIVFQALVNSAEEGVGYKNDFTVSAVDVLGQAIPTDQSERVSADNDPTDNAHAYVYGPLACTSEAMSVAFEDLKNVGWSDWDYNDVLVYMNIESCVTPADEVAVINVDYDLMSRGAGYNHDFHHNLPFFGGGRFYQALETNSGSLVESTTAEFGNGLDVTIFGDTWEALPPIGGFPNPFVNTDATQTDFVKSQHGSLVVVIDDPSQNPAAFLPPVPYDPYIYVHNTGEEVHLMIPGHLDNSQTVLPTFDANSPLLNQDLPLAHVFDATFDWPVEQYGLWYGYPNYADYILSGGTQSADWADAANSNPAYLWAYAPEMPSRSMNSNSVTTESSYFASPLVVDGDKVAIGNLVSNELEFYAADGTLIWAKNVGAGIKAAAVAADLDGNGSAEIIVGSADGRLHAFEQDGTQLSGWPVQVANYRILATPAIANIDADSGLEIVVPVADGRLYAINADGTAQWNVSIGDVADNFGGQVINSSPRIADLDGNGSLEIIVGSYDQNMYAFEADGSLLWSFETADPILGTPVVADLDNSVDGLEIAFGASIATGGFARSYLMILDQDGEELNSAFVSWQAVRASVAAYDLDGNGDLELLIGSDDGKLRAFNHDGSAVSGWTQTTGAAISGAPLIADVDGDGSAEILIGSDDGSVYGYELDGSELSGWPREASGSVKGSPALLDDATVVAADLNGELHRWDGQSVPSSITLQAMDSDSDTLGGIVLMSMVALFAISSCLVYFDISKKRKN